jgi:hypothetical protein
MSPQNSRSYHYIPYILYLNSVFIDVCNKLGRHLTNGWFIEDELHLLLVQEISDVPSPTPPLVSLVVSMRTECPLDL